MLRAILNKSCSQHPTKQHLYGHLSPITKTIQVRRTRHAGYCWRSKDELISDILRGSLHMDQQRQDDLLEPIYNSSVPIQDIALKTSQERWTIETGGDRGSGRSVLAMRPDDDDDTHVWYFPISGSFRWWFTKKKVVNSWFSKICLKFAVTLKKTSENITGRLIRIYFTKSFLKWIVININITVMRSICGINCGTAVSRNCGVARHQLWSSTNSRVSRQLWSYKCMSRCEPLIGRSFGWICLSRFPCPRCVVRPAVKVGVKLIRTSLVQAGSENSQLYWCCSLVN